MYCAEMRIKTPVFANVTLVLKIPLVCSPFELYFAHLVNYNFSSSQVKMQGFCSCHLKKIK